MPTYLIHGFRWQRPSIRIHIILQNLEDAAPDWIMAPASSNTILNSFYSMFDFLPPSQPPVEAYPLARKRDLDAERNGLNTSAGEYRRGSTRDGTIRGESRNGDDKSKIGHRTLTKRNKGSRASLGRLSMLDGLNGHNNKFFDPTKNPDDSSAHTGPGLEDKKGGTKEVKSKFNDWSVVKLLEQYDPADLHTTSHPYAYVADYMVEVGLSKSLREEIECYDRWIREEEGLGCTASGSSGENSPLTPGSGPAGNDRRGSTIGGGLASPPFSARELRRKSRRAGWFEKLRDGIEKGEDIGWFVVYCGDEERRGPSLEGVVEEDEGDVNGGPVKASRSAGFRGLFGRKKEKATVSE